MCRCVRIFLRAVIRLYNACSFNLRITVLSDTRKFSLSLIHHRAEKKGSWATTATMFKSSPSMMTGRLVPLRKSISLLPLFHASRQCRTLLYNLWDLKRFHYEWPPKESQLYRNYLPDELDQEMKTTPVKNAVLVQVLNDSLEEAHWAEQLAKHYPCIKGIVAGINLSKPEVESHICTLLNNPLVVGARHILDFEPDNWLNRSEVHRGLELLASHNLTFDLLLRPHLLKHAIPLVKKFSTIKFVVDHLAKPTIQKDNLNEAWEKGLEELGTYPNVYCKLSGMVTEAQGKWTPGDIQPYVQVAISAFGSERCMFGSDWPVCTAADANYSKVFETLLYCIQDLPDECQEDILGRTAMKFYGLWNLN